MSIKFPKMHIAASVTNRILNLNEQVQAAAAARRARVNQNRPGAPRPDGLQRYQAPNAPIMHGPLKGDVSVPDPALQGQQLDIQMAQPTQPSDAPPDVAPQIALKGLL